MNVGGTWRDFYTNTPLIGSPEDLQEVIEKPAVARSTSSASGENQEDGRRFVRGEGLAEMLGSPPSRWSIGVGTTWTTVLKLPAPDPKE
ncbi:MAG: hypothetical protein WDO56_21885 [Gammaproteobacteria bacterium]